jgi:hypothetical protein
MANAHMDVTEGDVAMCLSRAHKREDLSRVAGSRARHFISNVIKSYRVDCFFFFFDERDVA